MCYPCNRRTALLISRSRVDLGTQNRLGLTSLAPEEKTVGLWPAALCQQRARLWRALEQLFPLSFVAFEPEGAPRLGARVAAASDQSPAFLTAAPEGSLVSFPLNRSINGMGLRWAQQWNSSRIRCFCSFPRQKIKQMLTRRRCRRAGPSEWATAASARVDSSPGGTEAPLPEKSSRFQCAARAPLRDCFHGPTFSSAPSRYCSFCNTALVLNDPSLRWLSYGYINFQQLARHAQKHTVITRRLASDLLWMPFGWNGIDFVVIFRSNPARLSWRSTAAITSAWSGTAAQFFDARNVYSRPGAAPDREMERYLCRSVA